MKKLFSIICAGSLSLAMGITGAVPAMAAGAIAKPAVSQPTSTAIQLAQFSEGNADGRRVLDPSPRRIIREGRNFDRRDWRSDRRDYRSDRRASRDYRDWRGHRGYRDRRAGYRRHSDGFWYPLAAFAAGAAIGSAVGNSGVRSGSSSHVNYCANRYRSYRASDNTFQPYNGPRQQCRSPY